MDKLKYIQPQANLRDLFEHGSFRDGNIMMLCLLDLQFFIPIWGSTVKKGRLRQMPEEVKQKVS